MQGNDRELVRQEVLPNYSQIQIVGLANEHADEVVSRLSRNESPRASVAGDGALRT